ncbi:acetoacetate decarboxylase family protein [Streptomyces sp. NRRL B-1140]|uniref:acetoacetate decarboxylase family protein n=1 Tax=Streptomyces sp. NRRL B-1140 TaxID=1415549 RepID=UPI0006B0258F|nr:acetoacetate decarboxylase family protein [Streptomyces sp. NRRL B-1140]
MIVSLWRVPVDELPPWPLPSGVRPLTVRRRATLVGFWVDYRPGGVLTYREFLIALVARHGHGLTATTVAAWVDDEQSLAGGRALWGIPKERAAITLRLNGRSARGELTAPGSPALRLTYRDMLRLPCRLPGRAHLVQQLSDGTRCRVPLRISGRPALGRGRVTTGPGGALPDDVLSALGRHRPPLSLALRDFRSVVGS